MGSSPNGAYGRCGFPWSNPAAAARAAVREQPPPVAGDATDPPPHHPPQAKRAIHICLCGALSQVDSFDYKPALAKLARQVAARRAKSPTSSSARSACCARTTGTFSSGGRAGCGSPTCFPHLAERGRRADGHPLDGRRDVEPHAGDVSGEHRLPAQRFPGARRLAVATAWAARPTICRPSS